MIGKIRLLSWIGIVLLFVPHIGLPQAWKDILTVILGICVIVLSFKLKRVYKKMKLKIREYEQVVQQHETVVTSQESHNE